MLSSLRCLSSGPMRAALPDGAPLGSACAALPMGGVFGEYYLAVSKSAGVTGNLSVDGDKFVVVAADGNAAAAGRLKSTRR